LTFRFFVAYPSIVHGRNHRPYELI
jgi:hypothetical protein